MKDEKQRNEQTSKKTANWNGKLIEHIRDEALKSDNDFFVQSILPKVGILTAMRLALFFLYLSISKIAQTLNLKEFEIYPFFVRIPFLV